jgi:hypothetical protein
VNPGSDTKTVFRFQCTVLQLLGNEAVKPFYLYSAANASKALRELIMVFSPTQYASLK